MIGIYKITNKINNKSYIGQTHDIEKRFQDHRVRPFNSKSKDYNSVFYQAIRKYGIDNFSFEILEECATEELDEKEIYWINFYNTYIGWENSNGYNMTIGGYGIRKITQERVLELWREGLSQKEIAKIFSADSYTIHRYLCNGKVPEQEIIKRSYEYKSRKVNQYSLEGVLLNTFPSISAAVKSIKTVFPKAKTADICYACDSNKPHTTAYGYIWKYTEDTTPIETLVQQAKNVIHHRSRPVHQYSLDGEYLQTFSTMKEAAIACNIKCQSAITNVCTNKAITAGGYRWSYLKMPILLEKTKLPISKKGRCIAQYDLNNNLIKIYTNRQEAAKAINGKPQGISNVCCGSKKTYKGYIWKYSNQQEEVD